MKSNPPIVCQHLYELYPNIPKYANDPEESEIIRVYDLLLKRFQGIYGREPIYFVKCPATCILFGSASQPVELSIASICSLQNIVICVAPNGHQKIRLNHYQTAVYGEKTLETDPMRLKYSNESDEYWNILIGSLKTYTDLLSLHQIPGLDILLYDDFIKDDNLNWRQALSLGLAHAVHASINPLGSLSNLNQQFCRKYLRKLGSVVGMVKEQNLCMIPGCYNQVNVTKAKDKDKEKFDVKMVQFPKNFSIILAHSMTPMPKKLTQGKRENLRACQIKIGLQIIKSQLGFTSNIETIRNFAHMSDQLQQNLNCTTKQLLDTIQDYLPKEAVTSQQIQQLTQKSIIQILKQIPFANNVIDQNLSFNPYQRIKFYIEEQMSIQGLTCEKFGEEVKKSYQRGRDLLGICSEQVQEIVGIVDGLADGWKILGDGWGGYVVIVCRDDKVQVILDALVNDFYASPKNRMLLSDDIDQYIKVIGKPATGLLLLDPSSEIWYC